MTTIAIPTQKITFEDSEDLALITGAHLDTIIALRIPTRWNEPDLFKVDSIPFWAPDVHLFDIVEAEWTFGEMPQISRVVTPSGFKTLRVTLHPFNFQLDVETAFRRHPVHREWAAMGLRGERLWNEGQMEGLVFGVPPSFNVAKIDLLKLRHPDLLIELV